MKKLFDKFPVLIRGVKMNSVFRHAMMVLYLFLDPDKYYDTLEAFGFNVRRQINRAVQIPSSSKAVMVKVLTVFLCFFASHAGYGQDHYTVATDLNMRSAAGTKYPTIAILLKGDTLTLLDSSQGHWAKIQYQDKVGYAARQYIQKLEPAALKIETVAETETELKGNSGFSNFLIFILAIVIVTAIYLNKKGADERNKSTALLLSFFFGVFGFQKFYIGEKSKGAASILFSWTFIPTVIGIIDCIKWARLNEAKFYYKYNQGKASKTLENKQKNNLSERKTSAQIHIYDSIIDVNEEVLNLSVEKNPKNAEIYIEPAYWSDTYIFYYDEIGNATKAQREYYLYFKDKVINGEYVDIKDNTNYAFILYFDFLKEFEIHKDIKLLDEQFKLLGRICPKTRSYSLPFLQNEERKRKDSFSIEKLNDLGSHSYQFEYGYSDYNPDLYKLGNKYKVKLALTEQEIIWLNKVYDPSNVFSSIEGCLTATMLQYVSVLKELDKQLATNGTTFDKEVQNLMDKLKVIYSERSSEYGYYDIGYMVKRAETNLYGTIFKRVENSVREAYDHKRKLSEDSPYEYEGLSSEFEQNIGAAANKVILELKDNVEKPSVETQIALNAQNVNRWKVEFEVLKQVFKKEEREKFFDGITGLEETNQRNPNIENIFFEASKFIAKHDRTQALKYYANYIYYDLKSDKFDNKELTKTVQKSLFKTEEQLNDFKVIIADLIETREISVALDRISKIYIPKRKKIQLDRSKIKEVKQKHEGTVELLNEYLLDGKGDTEIENEESVEDDAEVTIITSGENDSIFIPGISMKRVQQQLLKIIVDNSFEITQDLVERYAVENGMFKNQLIESINEACEEHLNGEALIEEDDENYVIEESYYQEIIK